MCGLGSCHSILTSKILNRPKNINNSSWIRKREDIGQTAPPGLRDKWVQGVPVQRLKGQPHGNQPREENLNSTWKFLEVECRKVWNLKTSEAISHKEPPQYHDIYFQELNFQVPTIRIRKIFSSVSGREEPFEIYQSTLFLNNPEPNQLEYYQSLTDLAEECPAPAHLTISPT